MSSSALNVSRILPFSCVDGVGNRLVIFLQGCNFRCVNCHNPHTIRRCNHCGDCVKTCPTQALEYLAGRVQYHADLCIHCDACLQTCTCQSSPKTQWRSIESLLVEIRKYSAFLTGITFSGGEATLQWRGIQALCRAIKQDPNLSHLTCLIDTNGSLPIQHWQALLPDIDGAMVDLKSWGTEAHRQLTRRDNQNVFQTMDLLTKHQKLAEVRLLMVPDHSDYDEHFDALVRYLQKCSPETKLRLNAFRHHGVQGVGKTIPECTSAQLEAFAKRLEDNDLSPQYTLL